MNTTELEDFQGKVVHLEHWGYSLVCVEDSGEIYFNQINTRKKIRASTYSGEVRVLSGLRLTYKADRVLGEP